MRYHSDHRKDLLPNSIEREGCIVCGGNIAFIQVLENFPIYFGVSDYVESGIREDMEVCACEKCGLVQLKKLINPDLLYSKSHNSAIGKTWENHNFEFSKYIVKNNLSSILDVGGANMKIANLLCEHSSIKSYVICDFLSGHYGANGDKKISFIQGSVESIDDSEIYDAIVMSHTFEHFYDPIKVLRKVSKIISNNGLIFISTPNIEAQLKDGFLNAITFEHTFYINDEYLKMIASNAGYCVIDKYCFSKYNNFYTLKKDEKKESIIDFNKSCAKKVYKEHLENILCDIANINYLIKNKKVYCFGAHIFTQMLVQLGLNTDNVIGILDNDLNKVGKFLYGTNLMVFSPSIIGDKEDQVVIVRVAQYRDEIVKSLLEVNSRVEII